MPVNGNLQQSRLPPQESRGRRSSHSLARLGRPLCLALGIIFLIFGGYEVVERIWLTELDMRLLHMLHIARGIFSSLIVAVLVGWMILRSSPGFLVPSSTERESAQGRRLSVQERTKIYAQWFIAMRWIAVLVAVLLILVSTKIFDWLPEPVWLPLVAVVAVLGATNLLYTFLIRWDRGAPTMLLVQGYIDLAILTTLLHFSGGVENPLSTVMLFHVIIGGILLSRTQCYGIAAAGTLLFGWLICAELIGVWEHYTITIFPHVSEHDHVLHAAHEPLFVVSRLVMQATILFLTAYFVTTLAERMRYNERRLEDMAEQALAERQLLERALETTGAGVRVLDRDLKPHWTSTRWNEWFVAQTGANCPGCDLLNEADSPGRQCLEDGSIRVTELTLERANCSSALLQSLTAHRVFQITTAPLLSATGEILKIVELAQDVTSQKQTQAQILRAGKLAAIGELAGQVAHEVNNPIAIISAKANLLLLDHQEEMSPKIAQELRKIFDLATRVARIAQGLLSYCRPSAASRIRLDIRVPIRKSLAIIEGLARQNGVRVEDQLPDRLPSVHANADELEQVFLNLFLNALDAMPKGGWLKISAAANAVALPGPKAAVAIMVEDTGSGIPDSIRERIFEPFFTTKKEERGTGLGLSICLGLIRSHGGEIDVESKMWRGTRVTLKLPIVAEAEPKEQNHG